MYQEACFVAMQLIYCLTEDRSNRIKCYYGHFSFSLSMSMKYFRFSNKTLILASLTHLSVGSFLWDTGKQNRPRCDATDCDVHSAASSLGLFCLLFRNFIEK